MEGRYKVVEVDQGKGILHLQGVGGRRCRVQLGPKTLHSFVMGMRVTLRPIGESRLLMEVAAPGSMAWVEREEAMPRNGVQRRDRRGFPRVQFAGRTTVTVGSKSIQCRARDISVRGIAVCLSKSERLEGSLHLAFKLPTAARLLEASGSVVRLAPNGSDAVWGISFGEVSEDAAAALETFVEVTSAGRSGDLRPGGMDHSLASLYETAVAKLGDEPGV